jgi:hypothetical protein
VRVDRYRLAGFVKWNGRVNTGDLDRDLPPDPGGTPHYGVPGHSPSFLKGGRQEALWLNRRRNSPADGESADGKSADGKSADGKSCKSTFLAKLYFCL